MPSLATIGNWMSQHRASYERLSIPRKAAVNGLTLTLALGFALIIRAIGFDRSSFLQIAAVGLLLGTIISFGYLTFIGIVSERSRPGRHKH